MNSQILNLTKEDFQKSRWKDIIDSCQNKEYSEYHRAFWKEAEQAQDKEQAILKLLAAITFPALRPESMKEVFLQLKVFQTITDKQIDFLSAIVHDVSDPELKARITDFLWSIKQNKSMAQLAIPAYLESATKLENPEKWNQCYYRIERAYQLARQIKYDIETVISHIEAVLDRYQGEDPLWLSAKLMRLLQQNKVGNPVKYAALAEKYAALAEKAARRLENAHKWSIAREYWEIKVKWHRLEEDREKELNAFVSVAETYLKDAKDDSSPNYWRILSFAEDARTTLRDFSGTNKEKLNIKTKLEERNPWVKFSGIFKDDPLFDEFVEEMEKYRRKIDAEAADREISE
jgi:hypothetical protein